MLRGVLKGAHEVKWGGRCVNMRREVKRGSLKGGKEGVYTANCQTMKRQGGQIKNVENTT